MPYLELIQNLSKTAGPSGSEAACIQYLREIIDASDIMDETEVDLAGNLICHKNGDGPGIMFFTNVDVGGIFVHTVDQENRGYFNLMENLTAAELLSKKIRFQGYEGTIERIPESFEKENDLVTSGDLMVRSEHPIVVGAFGIPESTAKILENENFVTAGYLHKHLGIIALLQAMRALAETGKNIYFAFAGNSQEGNIGGTSVLREVSPALLVKVCGYEINGTEDIHCECGAVVKYNSGFGVYNLEKCRKLTNALSRASICFQRKANRVDAVMPPRTPSFEQTVAASNVSMFDIGVPFVKVDSETGKFYKKDIKCTEELLKIIANL